MNVPELALLWKTKTNKELKYTSFAYPTIQFMSIHLLTSWRSKNCFDRGQVFIFCFFLTIKKNMVSSQETTALRNVLNIMQHFPKLFSTINPAGRCPRWQNRIITSLVCFVFFFSKRSTLFTFQIENISFSRKRIDFYYFYVLNPNNNELWLFYVEKKYTIHIENISFY